MFYDATLLLSFMYESSVLGKLTVNHSLLIVLLTMNLLVWSQSRYLISHRSPTIRNGNVQF